jgi:hypothetical protein
MGAESGRCATAKIYRPSVGSFGFDIAEQSGYDLARMRYEIILSIVPRPTQHK